MVLVQLLLPTTIPGRPGSSYVPEALAMTRGELTAKFHGTTAYLRSPAKGTWAGSGGEVEHDEVVMVDIVTDRFDREWWRRYVSILAERFRQDTIHVRALPVELLANGHSAGAAE